MQAQSLRDFHVHSSVRGLNSCFKKKKKPFSIISGTQQRRTLRYCLASIAFFLGYMFLVRSGVAPYVVA